MICEKPTRAYPDGRTGTLAGWQAHFRAHEGPCDPCRKAANDKQRQVPRDARARWRQRAYARDPQVNRKANLKAKFGITVEQYDVMLAEQGGKCAVCGTTEPGGRWGTAFPIDHDHSCCPGQKSCGECIRGLLCSDCNVGLGAFADDPDRLMAAVAYLLSTRNVLEVADARS